MTEIQIEDNPKLRSFLRTTFEWSFSSLMWVLWIYLLWPLISLILWAIGLHAMFSNLFDRNVLQQLADLIKNMGLTVIIVFIIMTAWGRYNFYKFGRKERRKGRGLTVGPVDLGQHFDLSSTEVLNLQKQKVIVWTTYYDELIGARKLLDKPDHKSKS